VKNSSSRTAAVGVHLGSTGGPWGGFSESGLTTPPGRPSRGASFWALQHHHEASHLRQDQWVAFCPVPSAERDVLKKTAERQEQPRRVRPQHFEQRERNIQTKKRRPPARTMSSMCATAIPTQSIHRTLPPTPCHQHHLRPRGQAHRAAPPTSSPSSACASPPAAHPEKMRHESLVAPPLSPRYPIANASHRRRRAQQGVRGGSCAADSVFSLPRQQHDT